LGSRQSPTKVGAAYRRVDSAFLFSHTVFHSPFSGQRFARALKEGKARDSKPDEPFRDTGGAQLAAWIVPLGGRRLRRAVESGLQYSTMQLGSVLAIRVKNSCF